METITHVTRKLQWDTAAKLLKEGVVFVFIFKKMKNKEVGGF